MYGEMAKTHKAIRDWNSLPEYEKERRRKNRMKKTNQFSAEEQRKLQETGFVIYQLTGVSIDQLHDQRWGVNGSLRNDIRNLPSLHSQVAVQPRNWIIPKEDWSLDILRELEEKVVLRLEVNAEVITFAEAPTYAELVIQHFARTSQYLLSESQSIDTATYAGTAQYRLDDGFGYSNPVREYVYLSGPLGGYILWVGYHCRCHPRHNGVPLIVVPKRSS